VVGWECEGGKKRKKGREEKREKEEKKREKMTKKRERSCEWKFSVRVVVWARMNEVMVYESRECALCGVRED